MKTANIYLFIISGLFSIFWQLAAVAEDRSTLVSPTGEVLEVARRLAGVMETRTPASTGAVVTVRMITCRVEFTDVAAGNWVFLYQEQAITERRNRPYRQRFLQVLDTGERRVESRAFKPIMSEKWINFCDRPLGERRLTFPAIEPLNCSVFLRREGVNYIGTTPATGCRTNFRGAVRTTNEIILSPTGMETRDRGYDDRGNIIWGSREDPYRFRKIVNYPI
jgi:hypothetical protein